MCQYRSGKGVYVDDEYIRLHTLPDNDSHTKICESSGIHEEDGSALRNKQTPLEYVPSNNADLRNPRGKDWKLIFDAGKPDWWTDAHTTDVIRQFCDVIDGDWNGNILKRSGYLDLRSLTAIPEGVTLSAGGYLDLRSLTAIPEGVTVKAKHTYFKHSYFKH